MEHLSNELLQKLYSGKIKYKEAREIQKFISKNLIKVDPRSYKIVAGLDSAYFKKKMITAISFYDIEEKKVLHEEYIIEEVNYPYIPTLLFLREGPNMVKLAKSAKLQADVYLIDGHGEAHPYRAGLACFVGYMLDKPTIGVAKSRLFGKVEWFNGEGVLKDGEEVIALLIRLCNKEFYISVGQRVTLQGALQIFKKTIEGCISVPLERAHILANTIKAQYESSKISSSSA
ncbi:MAG TPA: endonuclease V [Geobacterales bacterium]|nr:endonuclease V [Geobacterales bacterium]